MLRQKLRSKHQENLNRQQHFLTEVGALKQGIERWKTELQNKCDLDEAALEQEHKLRSDLKTSNDMVALLNSKLIRMEATNNSAQQMLADYKCRAEERWQNSQLQLSHTTRMLEEARASVADLTHANELLRNKISHQKHESQVELQKTLAASKEAIAEAKADVEFEVKQMYLAKIQEITIEKDCKIEEKENLIQEIRISSAYLSHENKTLQFKISSLQQDKQTEVQKALLSSAEAVTKVKSDIECSVRKEYQARMEKLLAEKESSMEEKGELFQKIHESNTDLTRANETLRLEITRLRDEVQAALQKNATSEHEMLSRKESFFLRR